MTFDYTLRKAILLGVLGIDRIDCRDFIDVHTGTLKLRVFPTLWFGSYKAALDAEPKTFRPQSRDRRPDNSAWGAYRADAVKAAKDYFIVLNHERVSVEAFFAWLDTLTVDLRGTEFHGEIQVEFMFNDPAYLRIQKLNSAEEVIEIAVIGEA